jgi:predicted alpha/beta hydrolase
MQAIEAGNDPQGWLDQLEGSSLALAMRGELWLYPLVEVVHIIGFSLLVGAVVMFDLRVLGVSKDIAVTALARHLLPWALAALLLIVPAGLMMFSAHPHDFAGNGVFILKLCLIAAAGLNALAFHLGIYRTVSQWNTTSAAPGLAKAQAVLSVAIWFTVVLCGRLLAYT